MIEFKPDIKDNLVVYRAFENGTQTGRITLVLDSFSCSVKLIEAVDDETAEGLLRSALNAAANRGGYVAVYEPDEFRNVAGNLGFKTKNNSLSGEIPELLSGCSGCNNCN